MNSNSEIDNYEFDEALREITITAPKSLNSPYDRVRIMEWMKKLCDLPRDNAENPRIRNEYIQYLRTQLNNPQVHLLRPFKNRPPKSTNLTPLPELLGNIISEECPNLPKTGPIQPIICHKTEDGKAILSVKRCPEGGIFCYMAVSPTSMFEQ